MWAKTALGGTLALILGAAFWAGAAYQRFAAIEVELMGIHSDIGKLVDGQADIKLVINNEQEQQKRIEKLEDEVRQLK